MISRVSQIHLKLLPNERVTVSILAGLKIHEVHFLNVTLTHQFLTWVYLMFISVPCINSVKQTVSLSRRSAIFMWVLERSWVQLTACVNQT